MPISLYQFLACNDNIFFPLIIRELSMSMKQPLKKEKVEK